MNDLRRDKSAKQAALRHRRACSCCSCARRVYEDSVDCAASQANQSFKYGKCRLRKWGIDRPVIPGVWILCYPRTGSFLLCAILNRLGLNPPLEEWFHPRHAPDIEQPPKNNKVHPFQPSKEQDFSLSRLINRLPDTRFILLRRRDLIACAVSLYIAKQTEIWQVNTDAQAYMIQRINRITLDMDRLIATYRDVQRFDAHWRHELERKGLDYIEIFYEDLEQAQFDTVSKVLKYLHIDLNPNSLIADIPNRKQSIFRNETKEFIQNLTDILSERF